MKLNTLLVVPFLVATSHGALLWTVGLDDNAQPVDLLGGGANAAFVQEAGVNELPGAPDNPPVNQQADDDYYFAGVYSTVVDGGSYTPIGTVAVNETAAERAFAGTDNTLRYHFNLPAFLGESDQLKVTWDSVNLHIDAATHADPRYGVEVYFNGTKIADEVTIRPDLFDVDYSTTTTLGAVGAKAGEGFDNYVELRGINYNAEGGGNWMSVDYIQLESVDAVPEPSTGLLVFFGGLALLPVFRRRRS
ncbi:MAG: hypothetical protein ACI9R3_003859 [Verrucomicrobiales bacterium]|jgi:hypothetical protein